MDRLEKHVQATCSTWTLQDRKKLTLAGVLLPLLLFADDIVLVMQDPALTQKLLTSLSDWSSLSGLTVNVEKTFALVGGWKERAGFGPSKTFAHHDCSVSYRDVAIPIVPFFKYLGLHFDG